MSNKIDKLFKQTLEKEQFEYKASYFEALIQQGLPVRRSFFLRNKGWLLVIIPLLFIGTASMAYYGYEKYTALNQPTENDALAFGTATTEKQHLEQLPHTTASSKNHTARTTKTSPISDNAQNPSTALAIQVQFETKNTPYGPAIGRFANLKKGVPNISMTAPSIETEDAGWHAASYIAYDANRSGGVSAPTDQRQALSTYTMASTTSSHPRREHSPQYSTDRSLLALDANDEANETSSLSTSEALVNASNSLTNTTVSAAAVSSVESAPTPSLLLSSSALSVSATTTTASNKDASSAAAVSNPTPEDITLDSLDIALLQGLPSSELVSKQEQLELVHPFGRKNSSWFIGASTHYNFFSKQALGEEPFKKYMRLRIAGESVNNNLSYGIYAKRSGARWSYTAGLQMGAVSEEIGYLESKNIYEVTESYQFSGDTLSATPGSTGGSTVLVVSRVLDSTIVGQIDTVFGVRTNRVGYLELPLTIGFHHQMGRVTAEVQGGLNFLYAYSLNGYYLHESREFMTPMSEHFSRLSVSPMLGLELNYQLNGNWMLGTRFAYKMPNARFSPETRFTWKQTSLGVNLSYRLR